MTDFIDRLLRKFAVLHKDAFDHNDTHQQWLIEDMAQRAASLYGHPCGNSKLSMYRHLASLWPERKK